MPDLAECARRAYAAGWALSDGPMTDRVQAGCAAAVAHALEHAGDPRVLEVSLDLGHLEGTWAEVYKRREELTAGYVTRITAIWRRMVKRLKPREFALRYQHALADAAEADSGDPKARRKAEAAAAVLAWLYQILSDPEYADLAAAISEALIAAQAEGKTAALAVAADQAATYGFSWSRAYTAMRATVADMAQPGAADPVVQKIIATAAKDAGRVLASAEAQGASGSGLGTALLDTLGGEIVPAVDLETDFAMGQQMAQASLDLYATEGILVAWLTAGDGRVCPSCQDNEDNGPYDPAAFPACPDHPRCRCCPTPATPLPVSAFADFLVSVG